MSLDDALALADQILADYETLSRENAPGLELLWGDQLTRVLRELATAASACQARLVGDRLAAEAGGPGRMRNGLARMVRIWARPVLEPGAVVLSAADADTVWQALADAGAWHGVYGDCAVCVGAGVCGEKERHEVIAVQYAALRSLLGSDRR